MNFVDANLVSILVAAVAAWVFGAIYCTVLSKPWMAVQGKPWSSGAGRQVHPGEGSAFRRGLHQRDHHWLGALRHSLHVNMFSVRAGIISAALCWFGFVLATVSAGSELF
jgi:hypothetical protein